ncbi:MAG: hypothetical protein ACO1OF_08300 [Adhaeribacter sp.]
MPNRLKLEQIYLDEFLQVTVDNTANFIYVEWFRHPNSQDFRRLFKMLGDLTLANKSKFWLSDARAIHYIEFADQNWVIREMVPLLQQSNLAKFARLTTEESLAQLDIIRVYNMVEQLTELGINTKLELFTSKEAAMEWLFEEEANLSGNI